MASFPEQSASGLHPSKLTLYATANSDCSTRLRIALALKGLQYSYVASGSPHDSSSRPERYGALNPTNALPTLLVHSEDGSAVAIPQSLAVLEYLEEIQPSPPLLHITKSPVLRAHIRALALVIAGDTHPFTAPRVGKALREMVLGDKDATMQAAAIRAWDDAFVHKGLTAYEKMIANGPYSAILYSMGDRISMADVCLVPQVWRAQERGLDLSRYPTIQRIMQNLEEIDAIKSAHWDDQK